jgi:hypothetical protein
MAINSQSELQLQLNRIQSLDTFDVANIMGSAHYNASGRLDGMYARSLVAKASSLEIDGLLKAADAYHANYGGAIGGDVVRADAYPTGNPIRPCADRDNFWCWAG